MPIVLIGTALLAPVFVATPVPASPDGAEWETATNPEGCLACHLDASLSEPSDALTIEGLPGVPEAGRDYTLSITLTDPALRNAGFLLVITAETGSPGELTAVDGRTETIGTLARSTYDGTTPAEPGKGSWALRWTAPAAIEGPLRFDLWANAGNWDLSPLGDRLHHRSWQLAPTP